MSDKSYLGKLYARICAGVDFKINNFELDRDEMSGALFFHNEDIANGAIYCSPGVEYYFGGDDEERLLETGKTTVVFEVVNISGKTIQTKGVEFLMTFDLERDFKTYKRIVEQNLPELIKGLTQ